MNGTRRVFEIVYRIGVGIKGVDGAIELVAGLLLWLAPGVLHDALSDLAPGKPGDHPILNFVGYWAGHLDHTLAGGTPVAVIIFLLTHGIVKLALVYCLLREYVWVYPYALVVLALFTIYQGYELIRHPTIGIVVFTLLDVVIVVLVWREWRILRAKKQSAAKLAPTAA